jgi:hypothetical protein
MALLAKLLLVIAGVATGAALLLIGSGDLQVQWVGNQPTAEASYEPEPQQTVESELHPGETLTTDSLDEAEQILRLTERVSRLEDKVDRICNSGVVLDPNYGLGTRLLCP